MLQKLFFILLCIPWMASSQNVDSILQLRKELQYEAILQLNDKYNTKDSAEALAALQKLEAEFLHKKEPLLSRQLRIYQVLYRINHLPLMDTGRIVLAMAALNEARDKGWKVSEAEWLFHIGMHYYDRQRYGPAFDYLIHSHNLSKELGFAKYPNLSSTLVTTGLIYYRFGEYKTALEHFREVINLIDQWASPWSATNVLNSTGLCFQQLMQYDSAAYYFARASDYAKSVMHDTVYSIIIDGNRAKAYQLMGKTEQAIPLFELDYQYNQTHGAIGSATNAAIALGAIYLEKKDMTTVQKYLDFAHQHINRSDLHPAQLYYELNADVSRAKGNFAAALLYLDSARVLKDSLTKIDDAALLLQTKQQVEVEQYMHQLSVLEGRRKHQILIRDGLVIITLLLGITGIVWYYRRYQLRQKELKISELHQRIAEEQLEAARNELTSFTKMLTDKTALLESVQEELTKAKTDEKTSSVNIDLSSLVTRTILTEDDWNQFRNLFEKVYPGFFFRMKEKFADLTSADIRLLALTKLKLSPKEMGAMLGISYDGIKKSRRRLRQRINLPEEGSLEEVVESI